MTTNTPDDYTGDVMTGGPTATHRLDGLTVTKISVGAWDNNAYLLECTATGERLLIDAAADPARLLGLAGAAGLGHVLTTHHHFDHVGALEDVVAATGAITIMHPADAPLVNTPTDVLIRGGDEIKFGDVTLLAIHLVGHTLGSLALVYSEPSGRDHIWTGDCLFPGGIGKTYSDPATFLLLFDGVNNQIFGPHGDDTWIYPGHGHDTTLGVERPHLTDWMARRW